MARGRPVVRSRGRPPKNAESAQRLAAAKKPKYLYSGQGTQSSSSLRKATKANPRKSLSTKKAVGAAPWEEDEDDEEEEEDMFEEEEKLEEFEAEDEEMDEDEEEDKEEEEEADEEESEEDEKPARRVFRKSPPVLELEEDVDPLELPPSSTDLLVDSTQLMQCLSIYEILRHFSLTLRLQVFRFEDFLAALQVDESSAVLSQIHICLLKALLREDEANQTIQGPQDVKDSINGCLYFVDHFTWPKSLRIYLSGDERGRRIVKETMAAFEDFPLDAPLKARIDLLEYLCDCFLQTTPVRELITSSSLDKGTLRHDDHCRLCHKLGDLLCCEGCEAVYHLHCLEPPLESVPKDDIWICDVCKSMAVEGVSDCCSAVSCIGGRQEPIGYDRHGNKYWFMARRVLVETAADVFYYSLPQQLQQLIDCLSFDFEKELKESLLEMKEEICRQMQITVKLTTEAFSKLKMGDKKIKCWFEDQIAEEVKEDGEEDAGGVLTRLRTGTIQHKSINLDPLKKETNSNESEWLLMQLDEEKKALKRRSKRLVKELKSGFRLGVEGSCFFYRNKFNSNPLALNKHQHQEERDKKRFMSHKYSLTLASEFKWQGGSSTVFEARSDYIQAIRATLLHLEAQLCSPFLHPNWSLHKQNWMKAVNMCTTAKDFILALMILESSLKPCLFNALWLESLGHLHLQRLTLAEREDMKKNEKKEKRDFVEEQETQYLFSLARGGAVKYTLNKAKHQIWKQKGEEYRLTGKGGWLWISCLYCHKKKSQLKRTVEVEAEAGGEEEEVIDVSRDLLRRENRRHYKKLRSDSSLLKLDTLLERRILMEKIKEGFSKRQEEKQSKCYCPLCPQDSSCYSQLCKSEKEKNSSKAPIYLHRIVKQTIGANISYGLGRRTGKRVLGKGQLPPCPRFAPKSRGNQLKSIFILPSYELKKLSRNASLREVTGFSYTAKINHKYWKYNQTARPLFRTAWLFRNTINTSLAGVGLQLRILWSSLRWDDLNAKPPLNGQNIVTTDTQVITTELLKRRDLAPFGIRSEYLVRKIIVPTELSSSPPQLLATPVVKSDKPTRQGLRERKRKVVEEREKVGPSVHELWLNEEELELWEIKLFGEKLERQQQTVKEKLLKDVENEKFKKSLEESLKKQREEQKKKEAALQASSNTTPTTAIKRIFTSKASTEETPVGGYAMIKTANGQSYRVALSALKSSSTPPPPTIVIKTGNIQSNQRPLILQQPQQQLSQKIQIIRPQQQVQQVQQIVKTPTTSSAQIPLRMPDGRIQIVQIPISMLNSSQPIQIAIPATQQTTTTTTPTRIITTPILQQPQTGPQIRIISNLGQQTATPPRIIQFKQATGIPSNSTQIISTPASSAPQIKLKVNPTPVAPPVPTIIASPASASSPADNKRTIILAPNIKTTPVTTLATKSTPPVESGGIKRRKVETPATVPKVERRPLVSPTPEQINTVCASVLKSLVEKIEKEEKLEARNLKRVQEQKQLRWRSHQKKLESILGKKVEQLKKEILRKRLALEDKLRAEMRAEEEAKEREAEKRNREEERRKVKIVLKKSPAEDATGSKAKKAKKLYCLCKTEYDSSRFMVGCDSCHNWFHCDCLKVDEDQVKTMDNFICGDCKKEAEEEETYCLCKEAEYDETKFYVCCDVCQKWFHGKCVGLLQKEADLLPEYKCPLCDPNSFLNAANLKALKESHWAELHTLIQLLLSHRSSGPFSKPVDRRQVPDYYAVIKEPMDLKTIQRKVERREYHTLSQFIGDVQQILDNCRYYNAPNSPLIQLSNQLESFFIQKLQNTRQNIKH